MLSVAPGREDDFAYFRAWLSASAAVDRIIALTEEDAEIALRPLPRFLLANRAVRRTGLVPRRPLVPARADRS